MPNCRAAALTLPSRSNSTKNSAFCSAEYLAPGARPSSFVHIRQVERVNPSSRAAAVTVPKRSLASKNSALSSREYLRYFRTAWAIGEEPDFFLKEELCIDGGSMIVETPEYRGCCDDR